MFDREQFVEECRAALAESDAQGAINAIVKKAVSAPGEILSALGEPQLAGADRPTGVTAPTPVTTVSRPPLTALLPRA